MSNGVERGQERSVFVAVDNRIIPPTDFHREGLAASFQHYCCEIIAKLFMLSHQHSWIPSNLHILGAGSPSTASILPLKNTDRISSVLTVMEPRFSILGGNFMTDTTWNNFLVSIVSETVKIVSNNTDDKVLLVIYTTDFVLYGDGSSPQANIVDGMKKFLQTCANICQVLPHLEIRLVAVGINSLSQSHHQSMYQATTGYQEIFFNEVVSRKLPIKLDWLYVSGLQFDHELRHLLALVLPNPLTTIDLRPGNDPCKLYISLVAHTMSAADCVPHMTHMEYCGVSHRNGINPLFLAGYGLEVKTPNKQQAREQQIREQQFQYNATLLEALKMWLATHDVALIVKVPYNFPGEARSCSRFWALVPPAVPTGQQSTDQNMALILLTDRDQLIAHEATYSFAFDANHSSFADPNNSPAVMELFVAFQQLLSNLIQVPEEDKYYNPWTFVGGSFNAQFDSFRRPANVHTMQSSNNVSSLSKKKQLNLNDENDPPELQTVSASAKPSATLIPPPIMRSTTTNAKDAKKVAGVDTTNKTNNDTIANSNINTVKAPRGRSRKVTTNPQTSAQALNNNKSRPTVNQSNSSIPIQVPLINHDMGSERNLPSSKTVPRQSIQSPSPAHRIPTMSALELAKASHSLSISSPTIPDRLSSSRVSNANPSTAKVPTLHEVENSKDNIDDDENLFQTVPNIRPRFLKRKFSNLNKQISVSTEKSGNSTTVVAASDTTIMKEMAIDVISSDEEFPS